MNCYKIQFSNTSVAMPRFEYDFEMASHRMAKDYAARVLQLFAPLANLVSSFDLWDITAPSDPKLVARFELERSPAVRITEERM